MVGMSGGLWSLFSACRCIGNTSLLEPRTLGSSLSWSIFARFGAAQCYSFSVSVLIFSQVTLRLQVPCLRHPLSLSDHEAAEVSGIWGHSRVTTPAGSLLCITAPCHDAVPLCPCCERRLDCSRFLQFLVGAPCNGCASQVPVSYHFSTSCGIFSVWLLGVIGTCRFANLASALKSCCCTPRCVFASLFHLSHVV